MLVSLRRNSAKSKEKSVFITAWSHKFAPWCSPLSSAMSSWPMAIEAENRSDIIVFMLEFLRPWQLSHVLLHMPVLRADSAESRIGNLPAPPRRLSCKLQLQQGPENHICICNPEQNTWRCIPCSLLPDVLEYYLHQRNRTDYILNRWIQFVVEFAYSFCDVFLPIFTGKYTRKHYSLS